MDKDRHTHAHMYIHTYKDMCVHMYVYMLASYSLKTTGNMTLTPANVEKTPSLKQH